MQLGTHLRELWRLRLGVALSAALALLVAVSSIDTVSLFPPSLHDRNLEIAAASTHVLIDTPKSKIIDLRANTYDFSSLTTRADLLGNVMASAPVREYIGRRAAVDPARIEAVAPVTADVPRVLTEPGSEKRSSDILRSTDQYRLDIQANPTVPILDIYSQAPTKEAAVRLANSAVDGLRDYLLDLGRRQGITSDQQVRLEQLGRARGGVVNDGVRLQMALLSFMVVFTISCCAVLFLSRVRRGWLAAASRDRDEPTEGGDGVLLATARARDGL
jgi:hypothetical protein